MKQITLTFKMDKGLVGMWLESAEDNPTKEEKIVASQMLEYITGATIKSPVVSRASGKTIEEAKQRAGIGRDIYLSGRGEI